MVNFLMILICLFFTLSSVAAVGSEPSIAVERVLLEQSMSLAKQEYQVKAWVSSRQVFQQQALEIQVQLTSSHAENLPSLAVASQADSAWLAPMVSSEPKLLEREGKTLVRWQVLLFAKQTGINTLPNLRLQWVGESMSRQTQTLPSWSINVLPLPVYVPEQAIVGALVDVQTHLSLPTISLVDEVIQRHIQFRLMNHLPNSLWLSNIHGDAVEPLSAWLQAGESTWTDDGWVSDWTLWQPWRVTQAGFWQVEAQDLWVFNPHTWQVTHLQLPAHSGWAIPEWLWRSFQLLALLLALILFYWLQKLARCWLKRHHYQQAIERSADSAQLYALMVSSWQLTPNIPLAHQALPLPIYRCLVELENQLFSGEVLFNVRFVSLKSELVKQYRLFKC